jgi:hypothetical protein
VRDAFQPFALAELLDAQMSCSHAGGQRIYTARFGNASALTFSIEGLVRPGYGAFRRPHCVDRPHSIAWVVNGQS